MDRIVLVTYGLNDGGTDRVAAHLACGLADTGRAVTLLSCTSAGKLDSRFRALLGDRASLASLSNTRWKSRKKGKTRIFFRWLRWLRQNRPAIIMATGNNISRFTGLGVALMGSPRSRLYIKVTNPIIRENDKPVQAAIRRATYAWLFRRADGVLTLSDAQTRLLQKQFPESTDRFCAVYNPYLTAEYEAECLKQCPAPKAASMSLFAAGRLTPQKNFRRLLRAYSIALRQIPVGLETRLLIAGDGPEHAALKALADALGISQKIEFLGYTTDMAMWMAQSQIFILSSDYEGLPAVVVEALASECPVIATDCFANARELLADLPGCAVTLRNDMALGDALAKAIVARHAVLQDRPPLRQYALRYSTASAVESHLQAMQEL